MASVIKELTFCAAHRIPGAGKCANVHGHNFKVRVFIEGPMVYGMVVDFRDIKKRLGGWIDQHWDHGWLFDSSDPYGARIKDVLPDAKVFAMPGPPTAELLAKFLIESVCPGLFPGMVRVSRVEVWETDGSAGVAELS